MTFFFFPAWAKSTENTEGCTLKAFLVSHWGQLNCCPANIYSLTPNHLWQRILSCDLDVGLLHVIFFWSTDTGGGETVKVEVKIWNTIVYLHLFRSDSDLSQSSYYSYFWDPRRNSHGVESLQKQSHRDWSTWSPAWEQMLIFLGYSKGEVVLCVDKTHPWL